MTYGVGLVAPEVNLIVVLLDELKAKGLVPANRENIEGDLATNGELKVQVSELLLQSSDEIFTDVCCPVVLFEVITLGL